RGVIVYRGRGTRWPYKDLQAGGGFSGTIAHRNIRLSCGCQVCQERYKLRCDKRRIVRYLCQKCVGVLKCHLWYVTIQSFQFIWVICVRHAFGTLLSVGVDTNELWHQCNSVSLSPSYTPPTCPLTGHTAV